MDVLRTTINSATSPAGIALRLATALFAVGCIPTLPAQYKWVQTNFVTQTLLVGTLIYRGGVFGDNILYAFVAAAVAIAALNALNGGSPLGNLKPPFMA
jgi:hypothetical protein